MIVIVASRFDLLAPALASYWASHDARVLTTIDLSTGGWRYHAGAVDGVAVIGGARVPFSAVTGVLTRLPWVTDQELPQIIAADRHYVAAEMNALLRCWLDSLACPVVNRPAPNSLAGPAWWPERWIYTAARLGIPVRPVSRQAILGTRPPPDPSLRTVSVKVIGDRCFGAVADELVAHARRLATAARVALLEVVFSDPEADAVLIDAHVWPELNEPAIADAVQTYLLPEPGVRAEELTISSELHKLQRSTGRQARSSLEHSIPQRERGRLIGVPQEMPS